MPSRPYCFDRLFSFKLAWVLVALLISACGGGGGGGGADESSSPSMPPSATPPTITIQPQNALVYEGTSATFSVGAAGTAPLSYQWRRNGQNIAGATTHTYHVAAVVAADDGVQFSVVISNAAGSVTSNTATLDVYFGPELVFPTILGQPQNQTLAIGATAIFSLTATGSAPLTIEWRKNGVIIPGATGETYQTPPVTMADSGALYDANVSNAAGHITSIAAVLTVTPPPLAPAPSSVDSQNMSYLVSLATGGSSIGFANIAPQHLSTQGSATIGLAAVSNPNEVPSFFHSSISLDDFYHDNYYSNHSMPLRMLLMDDHVEGSVLGFDLDRYSGALLTDSGSRFSLLAKSIIVGIRSGIDQVAVGNWKYIGEGQSGYFAGFQTLRGSFVIGDPTDDAAIASIASAAYGGFAHGGMETEHVTLTSFDEFSAEASASYDASTGEITVEIKNFTRYNGDFYYHVMQPLDTRISSQWPNGSAPAPTAAMMVPLSCTATVDPTTNAFACSLTNPASNIQGTFKGRFYGPNGAEIGGSFAIVGLISGSSFDDGMVGAIALKAQ